MKENFIEIPFQKLDSEILKALIEDFIERDGTFYGEVELPMDQKRNRIIEQLKDKTAVITWNLDLESANIVLK